jgi:hypothetical protein
MPQSASYLFKNCLEYRPVDRIKQEVPPDVRGIYVLYDSPDDKTMNAVYIGRSRGVDFGVRSRLLTHSARKNGLWTDFSVYESLGQYYKITSRRVGRSIQARIREG